MKFQATGSHKEPSLRAEHIWQPSKVVRWGSIRSNQKFSPHAPELPLGISIRIRPPDNLDCNSLLTMHFGYPLM